MDPFQKLRNAIDKVQVNYVTPQEKYESAQRCTIGQNVNMKLTQYTTKQNDDFQGIWVQKQTQYIKQINRLSIKIEKLQKANKMYELQNQNLIKEICQLQKNNELLTQKLQQIGRGAIHWDDKQRKYRQEIHRINSTVNQLGGQLNQQRISKKNLNSDLQKLKDILNKKQEQFYSDNNYLKDKISILTQQNSERSKMLEYNIKKSADEKRQIKITLDNQKKLLQHQLQGIRKENAQNRQKVCISNGQTNLQRQKNQNLSQKLSQISIQNQSLKDKCSQLQGNLQVLQKQIQAYLEKEKSSSLQIQQLQDNLRLQRDNIKVKVIHLKDQSLQLQLQMYKKQCKQLLQEKAIKGTISHEYVVQEEKQIINPVKHQYTSSNLLNRTQRFSPIKCLNRTQRFSPIKCLNRMQKFNPNKYQNNIQRFSKINYQDGIQKICTTKNYICEQIVKQNARVQDKYQVSKIQHKDLVEQSDIKETVNNVQIVQNQ